ncbi:MAG: preprotein translocase subunit SecY [Oscillospiraceae bacterium]|jgi:preprotein translocase subunit SecY|nr:preprotein translocase subunit SecY [Oscillospiraceae bacterium]MCI8759095.1 preprotein translocase subunit SecY [Oscillospiraceae bacterium]
MIQTIRKAWGIPELRKKILFTLLILVIYRIGSAIPVPYVDTNTLSAYLNGMGTTILGLYNVMSGGAFAQATVFALGIQPYINSSIIIQLLTVAIPALERMQREGGEEGKKKLQSITRYATVGIAFLQALGYYFILRNGFNGQSMLTQDSIWVALVIMVSWVAGSSFLMWLGEQCNEFGVGNGISMILFAGIISRVPSMVSALYQGIISGTMHWGWTVLIVVGVLLLVVLIVFVNDAERRIPVQYAKRQVGRKMYGGQSSNLPMKVNMSGVLPIIFAQSIASIPATIGAFLPTRPAEGSFGYALLNAIDTKSFLYLVVYFVLIIGFSYFYASIQFNPVEISNNLKRNGGFIPGFRPGKPTSDFIAKVLNKVTLFGAIYLGVVAIVPLLADKFMAMSIGIGGTSVIIVVGVALETVKALENQMLMRQYKGFLE